MCSFSIGQVFFCKNSQMLGCANRNDWFSPDLCRFRSNLAQHAGLRPVCEDRANTRETCEQKTLKKQVVRKPCETVHKRAKIRAKKQVVRKSCENARKSVRKKNPRANGANISSKFHSWQENPQFCPKNCIFKFLTENRTGLRKKT